MCRADVLWVLYAVCGCVLCMVCAECVLYCAILEKCISIVFLPDSKTAPPGNKTGFRHFLPDSKMTPSGKETGR